MRLELLHHLIRVVDQREAGALAAAILCSEAEAGNLVFRGFVEFSEFGAELVFGDVGAIGVEDVTTWGTVSEAPLGLSLAEESV